MDLSKKTARNSLYSLAAFTVPIILSFFVTPFVVKHLGTEDYGMYALVLSFIGFFAIADLGVSPALVKYTAEYNARKEYLTLSRIFSSVIFFYLFIGTLAGIGIALFGWLVAPNLIKVSPGAAGKLQLVFYVAAFGFLCNMVLGAFAAIPGSLQRFDISSKINFIAAGLTAFLTVSLMYLNGGVVSLVILSVFTSIFFAIVYSQVNKRLIPQLRFIPKFDKSSFKMIFSFGGYAVVGMLAGTLLFEFDKIFIGATLGAAAVTFYVLPSSLAIKIYASMAALTNVVFPLSSELIAKGDVEKLQNLYYRAMRIIISLIILFTVPMYILSHNFLLSWVGPEFAEKSTLVFQLLIATYSILATSTIASFIALGAGKPKPTAVYAVVMGILNISLLLLLLPIFGLNGAAWAYLISVVPTLFFIAYVEVKILKINSLPFYLPLLGRLAIVIAVSLIAAMLLNTFNSSLVTFLFVYLGTVTIGVGAYLLLGIPDAKDLEMARAVMRKVRR